LSPETAPPPAKRTRKRRNEVELLWDWDESSELIPPPSLRRHPTHHRWCHEIYRHMICQFSIQSRQYWNCQRHL
jgi:hypothetical protein